MTEMDASVPPFRASSWCNTGGCVEVAPRAGGEVMVRDGKDRTRKPLIFGTQQWAGFVSGVKAGEFDFSSSGWEMK